MAIEELRERLRVLGQSKLRVGVFGTNAARVHPGSDGETVGEVAVRNHYGAPGVPARPFVTVAVRKHEQAIRTLGRAHATNPKLWDLLGVAVVGMVQETISDRVPPPNSPETIERKGSDVPLIDSGVMRQSIGYEVVK